MEPIKDMATTVYRPLERAAKLSTSSTTLPKVALSRPPTMSPKRTARSSVTSPRMRARGTSEMKFCMPDVFEAQNVKGRLLCCLQRSSGQAGSWALSCGCCTQLHSATCAYQYEHRNSAPVEEVCKESQGDGDQEHVHVARDEQTPDRLGV